MQKWFSRADEDSLWCYARVEALEKAIANPKVLDVVLLSCGAVGTTDKLKKMPVEDKIDTITKALATRRTMKGAFHGVHELEQLAAMIYGLDVPANVRNAVWPKVSKEADLLKPVSKYFKDEGFEVFAEVPMGRARIDVLARKKGGWFSAQRLVGVELKNDLAQLKRGLDQMTTFADYTHQIYLACTPALAAEYVASHVHGRAVQVWDAEVLNEKLKRAGIGLLLVRGNDVAEVLEADDTGIREQKVKELEAYLSGKPTLG